MGIIGKIVWGSQGMCKTPHELLLLLKPQGFTFPDADGSGTVRLPESIYFFRNLIQGLLTRNLAESAVRLFFQGPGNPVYMIKLVNGRASPGTHLAPIDRMPFKRGDGGNHAILHVDVDGTTGIAHAAQGLNNPVLYDCFNFHFRNLARFDRDWSSAFYPCAFV